MTSPALLIPNALSVSRLVLAAYFPFAPDSWRFPIVLFAAISDLVDGWLSRQLHAMSDFGRIIDPIADKAFVFAVLATFLYEGRLAPWEILLIATRDIVVLGGLIVQTVRGRQGKIKASLLGKLATAAQLFWLVSLFLLKPPMLTIVFDIAVFCSGLAAFDYLMQAFKSGATTPAAP